MPDKLFNYEKVQDILKSVKSDRSTYYKAILQNLFFATLNTPREDRRFREQKTYNKGWNKDFGNHDIYRYEEIFEEPDSILKHFKDIPFLNGGIFECLDQKKEKPREYIDGFTRTKKYQPEVPNFLFFSNEQKVDLSNHFESGHKEESVRGLIKILEDYNFTIDENTPIDKEVSLDPELLGHIFENLLASYNPETKSTARKATGSYYTPRQIVEFMTDESLKQYFINELEESGGQRENLEAKVDDLLSYHTEEHDFDEREVETLINSIYELKVIDPAVGSGAFPMGVLQKLVLVLSKLDPNNRRWKQKQIEAVKENVTDGNLKNKLIQSIEDDFKENRLDYGRKLYLIRNSIYGVDIQPIAIQIAKLRFFISLLVDEKIDESTKNMGIEPLPNLETNFVAADTLKRLGESDEATAGFKPTKVETLESELRDIRSDYFNANSRKEKESLKERDEKIRQDLLKELKESQYSQESENLDRMANWNPYETNNVADFFDPEWMFAVDDFDIAIANPPYIQLQKDGGKLADRYEDQDYETFRRTGDIYCLFYERGLELVDDQDGLLCYISSNKWMRANYGKNLRGFLSDKSPVKLINFGGHRVFEGPTVDVNILLVSNSPTNDLKATKIGTDFVEGEDLGEYFSEKSIPLDGLSKDTWFIGTKKEMELKRKIEEIGTPLMDWSIDINYGIKTGYNKAFIIDEEKKNELIEKDPKSEEIIKPILRGRDIERYGYEFAGKYLITTHNGYEDSSGNIIPRIEIEDYPTIQDYLDQFWERLESRYDQGDTPYNLRNCAYFEEFEKEKIVWQEIASEPRFAKTNEQVFVPNTAYILTEYSAYLLGYLNSRLTEWYFPQIAQSLGSKGLRYLHQFVSLIPVPKKSKNNRKTRKQIEELVRKILGKKKHDLGSDTSGIEKQIDQLVYQLHNLNSKEVDIIENQAQ